MSRLATGNFDLQDLAKLKALKNCHSLKVIGQIFDEWKLQLKESRIILS